jgi:hypothetical protein
VGDDPESRSRLVQRADRRDSDQTPVLAVLSRRQLDDRDVEITD